MQRRGRVVVDGAVGVHDSVPGRSQPGEGRGRGGGEERGSPRVDGAVLANHVQVHADGEGVHVCAEPVPVPLLADHDADEVDEHGGRPGLGAHVVDAHPVQGGVGGENANLLDGQRRRGDGVGTDEPLADEEAVVGVGGASASAASADRLPARDLVVGHGLGVGQVGPVVPYVHAGGLVDSVGDRVLRDAGVEVAAEEEEQDAAPAAVLVHEVGCLLLIELDGGVEISAAVVDASELAEEVDDNVRVPVDGAVGGHLEHADQVSNAEEDDFAWVFGRELVDFPDDIVEGLASVSDGDVGFFVAEVHGPEAVVVLVG